MHKRPILPDKLRRPPSQFSWIDQRFVRERYIDRLSHQACALYLFLLTVADARGLSYYSASSLSRRLSMSQSDLHKARQELMRHGLIAYQKPLYQVLTLDDCSPAFVPQTSPMSASDKPMAIKEIFKHIAETLS